MKYMLIMRATDAAIEASAGVPFEEVVESMGRYNQSLIAAGVLLSAEGLAPAEEGLVIDFTTTPPAVTDGPYGETHELFNGYWIIETSTRDEAVEWASRAPLGAGVKLEFRRVASIDEFDLDSDAIKAEAEWRDATGQR